MEEWQEVEEEIHDLQLKKKLLQEAIVKQRLQLEEEYQSHRQRIEHEQKLIQQEKERIVDQQLRSLRKVKLDVGGHFFTTSITTLTSEPDSMLSAMFSGRHKMQVCNSTWRRIHSQTDDEGRYFIDRNGELFSHILNWLRTHEPVYVKTIQEKHDLGKEAKYYGFDIPIQCEEEDNKNKITQTTLMKLHTNARGTPLYLNSHDLRQLDLQGWNCKGWLFTNSDLSHANLESANLQSANLKGATLIGAILTNANAKGANMNNARLINANLNNTNLTSEMGSSSVMSWTTLNGADLSGASLVGADLTGSNLLDANLSESNLTGAILSWANLSNTNLSGANLTNAHMQNTTLVQANFSNANLNGANLSQADLTGADLSGADLRNATLDSAKLLGAKLTHANLDSVKMIGTRLVDADLTFSNLLNVECTSVEIKGAHFSGAQLSSDKIYRQTDNHHTAITMNLVVTSKESGSTQNVFFREPIVSQMGLRRQRSK